MKALVSEINYTKISIESCDGGWIVMEQGQPTKLFVRWDALVRYLQDRLAS